MRSKTRSKADRSCVECGDPKGIIAYGHPDFMVEVFGVGRTENVRLCDLCRIKFDNLATCQKDVGIVDEVSEDFPALNPEVKDAMEQMLLLP